MGRDLERLRILAIADLHGRVEPLSKLEGQDFDLVLTCGDIHGRGTRSDARSLVETLASFSPTVLAHLRRTLYLFFVICIGRSPSTNLI